MARQQPRYRHALPQLNCGLYLSDGGLETDLIFNHGIPIKGFASHTLLPGESTRLAMTNYYRGFLSLAQVMDTGFILDGQTWKAHAHWADDLDESIDELREANRTSVAYIAALRDEYAANRQPIVLNCSLGPRGDAYAPDYQISAREAEDYHRLQLSWLAETQVDMVTAMTFTQAEEAIGIVRAAKAGLQAGDVSLQPRDRVRGLLPGRFELFFEVLGLGQGVRSPTEEGCRPDQVQDDEDPSDGTHDTPPDGVWGVLGGWPFGPRDRSSASGARL